MVYDDETPDRDYDPELEWSLSLGMSPTEIGNGTYVTHRPINLPAGNFDISDLFSRAVAQSDFGEGKTVAYRSINPLEGILGIHFLSGIYEYPIRLESWARVGEGAEFRFTVLGRPTERTS